MCTWLPITPFKPHPASRKREAFVLTTGFEVSRIRIPFFKPYHSLQEFERGICFNHRLEMYFIITFLKPYHSLQEESEERHLFWPQAWGVHSYILRALYIRRPPGREAFLLTTGMRWTQSKRVWCYTWMIINIVLLCVCGCEKGIPNKVGRL